MACGDWDRDGDTDIFIEMGGAGNGDRYHNILFQNPGHENHFLTVKLVGQNLRLIPRQIANNEK